MKVALVTGAASGIGRATAALLAHAGYAVVAADVDVVALEKATAAIGDRAAAVAGDVRRAADCERMAAVARERFGGLDAVACVAGIEIDRPAHELDETDWDAVVDTSLKGTFLVCRAAIPLLLESGGGAIVTVGSVLGRACLPGTPGYSAAKAGLEGLTRSLALDYARAGIRANCVLPGTTDTPLAWIGVPPEALAAVKEETAALTPMGRIADPEEIARVIAFLCSDGASFMTGSCVVVDGGLLARIVAPAFYG